MVKLRLRDNEKIQDAVKRFRKLVEHAGIKKEMRRRNTTRTPVMRLDGHVVVRPDEREWARSESPVGVTP
ncbi:MAG: hypothetical protein Ct9H300mP1_13120 [Planctomycetaceae bacterium]|nr:MAG: hypothetical protein Ct9H300mP1_13120 [Planctomycetaceae bacterium]